MYCGGRYIYVCICTVDKLDPGVPPILYSSELIILAMVDWRPCSVYHPEHDVCEGSSDM